MGWNCNNCGSLLRPDLPRTEDIKLFWHLTRVASLFPGEPRVCVCPNCQARFVIVQGEQPRIYLRSIMICLDDGEGDGGSKTH